MAEVNVERWKPHLDEARKQGVSLAQYAREHGLSRHTLYMTNMELRRADQSTRAKVKPGRKAKLQMSKPSSNEFVPVRLARETKESAALRMCFPNGTELHIDAAAPAYCVAVITALASLPCSP